MRYQIELTHSKSIHTAVIRGRVRAKELPQFVPAACGEVWSFIRSASLPRPGRHLALYLDAQGSVEVGAEVSEPFAGNDRVHCSRLPAGRVVTATHFGPYARLSEAHAAIRKWCVERGHRCSVISWEIYGHWEESWNADPSKIRTDVFYLLDDAKVAVFVAADDAYARDRFGFGDGFRALDCGVLYQARLLESAGNLIRLIIKSEGFGVNYAIVNPPPAATQTLRREATAHPYVSPFVQRVERQQRWFGFGANTARELFGGFAISNLRCPFRLNYSGQERKQNPWLFHGCNIPPVSKVA